MPEMKRVLLTGVSGFIGHHLAGELMRTGHEVSVVVRSGFSHDRIPSGALVYEHDGSTEGMISILSAARPELVFHLASCFLARHKAEDIDRLVDSNLRFGLQLLEAMAQNGCRRLINTGTGWQHFEGRTDDPVCLYAATKSAFECLLDYYVNAEQFIVTTLKLHDTYGPRDPRGKLISLLLAAAKSGEPLDLSPGEQKIDLTHIDDIVRAFICCKKQFELSELSGKRSYMASSGNPISIRKLVEVIESVTRRRIIANWGARTYREREVMIPWNEAPLPPEWNPDISLESGIRSLCSQLGM
jgi:nucleoside-diphosphate-sugar epimerase